MASESARASLLAVDERRRLSSKTAGRVRSAAPEAGVSQRRVKQPLAARAARLLEVDSATPPWPGIKPSYWAYLRACIHLIDAGKPCTQLNLANELGISPQAVWKYLRRHPGVLGFVAREMRAQNEHFLSPIVRRHSMLAMQGSVASADFVAKVEGGYYLRVARPGANDEDEDSPEDSRFVTHVNILVPCPQLPNGGRMPQLGPQPGIGLPAGVDLKDIPTVAVR